MLTSALEPGVRHDGGDAETGSGVEFGRTLVAHGDATYREWRASASVRLDPGAAARGLSLSLSPEWGAAGMGGAEPLWTVRDAGELAHGCGFDAGMRLRADVGYGLDAFRGRGTVTPFVGAWSGALVAGRTRCSARRRSSRASAGDFADVDPDKPAAHGRIVAVRADGRLPGSAGEGAEGPAHRGAGGGVAPAGSLRRYGEEPHGAPALAGEEDWQAGDRAPGQRELRGRRAVRALNRDLLQLRRRAGGDGSNATRRDRPHQSARPCSATSGVPP